VIDVLKRLQAEVLHRQIQLVADLLVDRFGDADPTRIRERLQTRGNVHAVTVDVVVLDNHITEMHADARVEALLGKAAGVARRLVLLNAHGAPHRIHDTVELPKDGIPGRIDDAAFGLPDDVPHLLVELLDEADGTLLVVAHHPAEAADIDHHDRGQLAAPARRHRWRRVSGRLGA
jgi:hypothetical protein